MDPPSFQPFNPRSQLATYIRNLPHWRQLGASYFITFHLADSLPQAQLAQAKILRQQRDGVFSDPHASKHGSLSLEIQRKTEKWLDAGYGSCLLSRPKVLGATAAALTHFHDERYHLIAYVIMPNHCHVALQPRGDATLESILQSRKSFTSREANRLTNRTGKVWHEESFDRIIRDESHMYRVIRYIECNPAKAHLGPEKTHLGISKEWHTWYQERKGEPTRFTVH